MLQMGGKLVHNHFQRCFWRYYLELNIFPVIRYGNHSHNKNFCACVPRDKNTYGIVLYDSSKLEMLITIRTTSGNYVHSMNISFIF